MGFFLDWNVFLGFLPLVFAHSYKKSGTAIKKLVFFGMWLLFFPNAIYLVTDFIHLSQEVFYIRDSSFVIYTREINMWITLISIVIAFILSTCFGLESFYLLFEDMGTRYGKKYAWILAGVVSSLTGLGIYIGRFLRFNSWDILNPLGLLKGTVLSLDVFALEFIFLFSIYTFSIFILYLFNRNRKV